MIYKFKQFSKLNEDEDLEEEIEDEDEEDAEPSDEKVEAAYRLFLKDLDIDELISYTGRNIWNYVDDEKFIDDHADSDVERYNDDSKGFRSICEPEDVRKFLSSTEDEDNIESRSKTIKEWGKTKLREKFDDDEEYEWELDLIEGKSADEIVDDLDDNDDCVELLEELGLVDEYIRFNFKSTYRDAESLIVGNFCSKEDMNCILGYVKNYIDEEEMIDDIVRDTDYYTMREFV